MNIKKNVAKSAKKIQLQKRFIGKATGHNDHYMINMGGQRLKAGGD